MLVEENERYSSIFNDKFSAVATFVCEFQRNIQDLLSYQRNKQEVLRSVRELNEKNVRQEREIKKMAAELEEEKQTTSLQASVISKLEGNLIAEIQKAGNTFQEFIKSSALTRNRQALDISNQKIIELENKVEELTTEMASQKEGLLRKLNQKQVECDLLRIDYKELKEDNEKKEAVKERNIHTVRKVSKRMTEISSSNTSSSSDECKKLVKKNPLPMKSPIKEKEKNKNLKKGKRHQSEFQAELLNRLNKYN